MEVFFGCAILKCRNWHPSRMNECPLILPCLHSAQIDYSDKADSPNLSSCSVSGILIQQRNPIGTVSFFVQVVYMLPILLDEVGSWYNNYFLCNPENKLIPWCCHQIFLLSLFCLLARQTLPISADDKIASPSCFLVETDNYQSNCVMWSEEWISANIL